MTENVNQRTSIESQIESNLDSDEFDDHRLEFIVSYLKLVAGITPVTFKTVVLSNEHNRSIINSFLDRNRLLIFENADSINVYNEFPRQFKSKIICFVKREEKPIDKDISMKRQILITEFSHSSLSQLNLFISQILWPLLQRPQFVGHWPDILVRHCMQNLSALTNILTRINEMADGRTILAIPDEIEFLKRSDYLRLLSHSTLHRGKIRLLENLVLTWKTQIQSAIDDDRDPIDPSPKAEIDFWIFRTENLQAIQRQMNSPLVRRLAEVLEISNSTYFAGFRSLFRDLIEASAEAENISLFLRPLIPLVESIEKVQELSQVSSHFHRLFHTLALTWAHSMYYIKAKRFLSFLKRWCDLIVSKLRNLLEPNDLFVENDFDESIQSIDFALEICSSLKIAFQQRQTSLSNYFKDREIKFWQFPQSKIFHNVEEFSHRLKMIKEIIDTVRQCSIYETIEFGGIDADELQEILQRVISDLKLSYNAFRGLNDDVTDEKNKQFVELYEKFRRNVSTNDLRVANILRRLFDSCQDKSGEVHFDSICRVSLYGQIV